MNRIQRHHSPRRGRTGLALGIALVTLGAAGCQAYGNYPDPLGPRHAGVPESAPALEAEESGPDTLIVVTFNVKEGAHVDRAIAALRSDSITRRADILLLQEMDADGTRRIAEAMAMHWVYYPAWFDRHGDGFGNAVMSRWPILDDAKLILPHRAFFNDLQRTATAATVDVAGTPVRVYSIHMATRFNLATWKRLDQLGALFEDAARHPRSIVGGDLNSNDLSQWAVDRGFAWPTRDVPYTIYCFRWDHIYYRGVEALFAGAGTVSDNRDASDHRPVWLKLALPPEELERLPERAPER